MNYNTTNNKPQIAPTDIYNATQLMIDLKSKFINIPQDTLALGIFGYLSDVNSHILETTTLMASEYSQEAIPTKAKYAKNIIAHALSFGINQIFAKPATMQVTMFLNQSQIENSMQNEIFRIDRDYKFHFNKPNTELHKPKDLLDSSNEYEFHLPYDIVITRSKIGNNKYVFTAQYDMKEKNIFSDIDNPYLPTIGVIQISGQNFLVLTTSIIQMAYSYQSKRYISANPLEAKSFMFNFEGKLAGFFVRAVQNNITYNITPVYDGLYNDTAEYFCNYTLINENTIRVIFNRDSYEPTANTQIEVVLITTDGSEGNFQYTDSALFVLASDKYNYSSIDCMLTPLTNSQGGRDDKSIAELKKLIPKEALSRGSITNYQDLNNYFNTINADDINNGKLYIMKKIDNNIDRLYYAYLVLKMDGHVIPMNTIPLDILRNQFDTMSDDNYVLKPGNIIDNFRGVTKVLSNPTDKEIQTLKDRNHFIYFNPFLCIVHKSPFYVSYLLTIINTQRKLNFDFINQNSVYQYISTMVNWERPFFDRDGKADTYTLTVAFNQNIDPESSNIIIRDNHDKIIKIEMQAIAIVYGGKDNKPYRWFQGTLKDYNEPTKRFTFDFEMKTSNRFDSQNEIEIKNCKGLKSYSEEYGFLPNNTKVDIYVLIKGQGTRYDLDDYIPGQDGWIVTNKYSVVNGLPMYYNYSGIINSYIDVDGTTQILKYHIDKFPVLQKDFFYQKDPKVADHRIYGFVNAIESKRSYINQCMLRLEDSFGIDLKFFNTYGQSYEFHTSATGLIDKTCLSLKFRLEFRNPQDSYMLPMIANDIKDYIENMDIVNRIDMPNLMDYIKDKYNQSLLFFEFLDFNGYGPKYTHLWRKPFEDDVSKTPEFLNVGTKDDGTPDITFEFSDI